MSVQLTMEDVQIFVPTQVALTAVDALMDSSLDLMVELVKVRDLINNI